MAKNVLQTNINCEPTLKIGYEFIVYNKRDKNFIFKAKWKKEARVP